ncbi:septum formation initiator family protein [Allokutzneria sp. A3M-2-11 16]|uniref:FtsB family cell division protein n=1 Tax=Allokutzneria sp. A3M-2-11 16 TaxID=2962043 RepID=UPI0020B8A64D|nr:septum formation initiator family protein [Allokutzneria sp. A3M-2-11 16]MCP3798729.1 septum formation initiator family protein [Allokutzneria sp. A3M-2-11 16]
MAGRDQDRERRRRRTEAAAARRPERAQRRLSGWTGIRGDRSDRSDRSERGERAGRPHAREQQPGSPHRGGPPRRTPQPRRPRMAPKAAGAFQLSSTRRAAMLALVVCALVLSVAVPLRTYISQRSEIRQETLLQQQNAAEVRRLEERKAQLLDPAQVEAEARRRLKYVNPGETPYVVELPTPAAPQEQDNTKQVAPNKTWFERLWETIVGG